MVSYELWRADQYFVQRENLQRQQNSTQQTFVRIALYLSPRSCCRIGAKVFGHVYFVNILCDSAINIRLPFAKRTGFKVLLLPSSVCVLQEKGNAEAARMVASQLILLIYWLLLFSIFCTLNSSINPTGSSIWQTTISEIRTKSIRSIACWPRFQRENTRNICRKNFHSCAC